MKYWKITNQDEKHYDMQYRTGLNVDVLPFRPYGDCEPGGIYYSDTTHILAFLSTPCGPGKWIREVTLPKGELTYENPRHPKKWKAHRVILGERKKITPEVIAELLDLGADIHADNNCALRLAAKYGYTDIVELLLDRGADIHAANNCALRWAAKYGHTDTVKLLLDRGADIHTANDWALFAAADNGHTDTVKLLLDRGADIHANNDRALRWAAGSGHTDTVELLLDRGADIHAWYDRALYISADNGHADTVELLLNRGAHRQKMWGY